MKKLQRSLLKYGNIEMMKEGKVFTLLITAESGLDSYRNVQEIQEKVNAEMAGKFPHIECMKNDSKFFLLVLS